MLPLYTGAEPKPVHTFEGFPPLAVERFTALECEMRASGHPAARVETYRSPERQAFLYKIGRELRLPDGRGEGGKTVTNAAHGGTSFHFYRLAVDYCPTSWNWEDRVFFRTLRDVANRLGLLSGSDWNHNGRSDDESFIDSPHVQIPTVRSPTDQDRADFAAGNLTAVWKRYGV